MVYIDEAGDEGFRFLPGERGSSRWLVLSAVIVRTGNDALIREALREVRTQLGKPEKFPLHFKNLRHEQCVAYARRLAEVPCRTVSVLINKTLINEPEKFSQEPHRMYRYASRLLLERVSWCCRDNRQADDGDGTAELIFSNRSAMSYDDLRSYLGHLRATSTEKDIRIDWDVVSPDAVRAVNHDQLAGLQFADAVASGTWRAVSLNPYGNAEPRYLELLSRVIYRNKKTASGYGLKFWPFDYRIQMKTLEHLAAIERFM